MANQERKTQGRQCSFFSIASVVLILSILTSSGLVGCGSSTKGLATADPAAVDYTPLSRDDWPVSTPAEQGLDPDLVDELYSDAADLDTIYSLLVVKNGHLIAESYFSVMLQVQ